MTDISDTMAEKIYEAGCDDALLGQHDNEVYLDFDREAGSLDDAVNEATLQIESCGYKVDRIENDRKPITPISPTMDNRMKIDRAHVQVAAGFDALTKVIDGLSTIMDSINKIEDALGPTFDAVRVAFDCWNRADELLGDLDTEPPKEEEDVRGKKN